MDHKSGRFYFDGGAGSYLVTGIRAAFITICTFGMGFPYALVLLERWRAKHTYINGQRLMFSGTGIGLFALLIKLCLLLLYHLWHLLLLGGAPSPGVEGRAHRLRSHLAAQNPRLNPSAGPSDFAMADPRTECV